MKTSPGALRTQTLFFAPALYSIQPSNLVLALIQPSPPTNDGKEEREGGSQEEGVVKGADSIRREEAHETTAYEGVVVEAVG